MLLAVISALSLICGVSVCFGFDCFSGLSWLWVLPLGFLGCFLLLVGIGFGFLMVLCRRVDQSVPQEGDDKLYRVVTELIIDAALPFLRIHVKKQGLEKIPASGRFLLVCNHLKDMDPVTLLWFFRKSQLAFISKKENNKLPAVAQLMHKTLCQCIDRDDDRQALQVILKCIRILKEDKASVCVFPEGSTNHDELLHPFRPGVFKIAQKANVPIVVCTLRNTRPVIHNGLRLKPTHMELRLLDVIPAESLKGRTAVDISNQVYQMMADDLGPAMIAAE